MAEFSPSQLALVATIFVWSGFVRSGLGFGGAVLSLPFLLLVHDDPLLFLPLIATQLLLFSSLMWAQQWHAARRDGTPAEGGIDWAYLRHAMGVMIVPKLIGVFGLLTLPARVMASVIFVIVAVYAISYILDRPFKSGNRALDPLFLALGGYMSGTSLVGAPLLIAVFAHHVAAAKLRDTLFALWFVLVAIKMTAFVWAGVDLQLVHQAWLLPCAALGHLLGLRFHDYLMRADPKRFYRLLGCVLLVASGAGLFA